MPETYLVIQDATGKVLAGNLPYVHCGAGVFLLAIIANMLNLLGISPFAQRVVNGVVIAGSGCGAFMVDSDRQATWIASHPRA